MQIYSKHLLNIANTPPGLYLQGFVYNCCFSVLLFFKEKPTNLSIMPIIVNLDVIMAKRKMSLNELSERVDLTFSNLSVLKTGKTKAVRFSTPEAICKALDCQPGHIL